MSLQDEFIDDLNELLQNDTENNNNKLIATINNPTFNVNNPINYNGKNQFPLFLCAGYFLKKKILQTLLDKGADINAIDEDSNNILGYLITRMIEEYYDDEEVDNFIRTFYFLMYKKANIYYINSVSSLSIFDLTEELGNYYSSSAIKTFIEYILSLMDRELIIRNTNYLRLLNSIFSKIKLVFNLTSQLNDEYCVFEISPETCNTVYGLIIVIDEEHDVSIQLLSNCKKQKGTTILNLIKEFSCKINANYVILLDEQSLIIDLDKKLIIQNMAILDIAVNGESWYNKNGFYKENEANPEEYKKINMDKSQESLSSVIIKKKKLVELFKKEFEIDHDIDVNDSIRNIFTIIKRDYLKNKTKQITKEQCNVITTILEKLSKYYNYNKELYYNCKSSKSSKSIRRRSFDSWKPKSIKKYNSHSY